MKANPEINQYKSARHHSFSVYNKYNELGKAYSTLDMKEYSQIPFHIKEGLRAELYFFHKFKETYNLIPALDCGDKTDFSGFIEEIPARIDVTTNIQLKRENLSLYDEFIAKDESFWIAEVILSHTSG